MVDTAAHEDGRLEAEFEAPLADMERLANSLRSATQGRVDGLWREGENEEDADHGGADVEDGDCGQGDDEETPPAKTKASADSPQPPRRRTKRKVKTPGSTTIQRSILRQSCKTQTS